MTTTSPSPQPRYSSLSDQPWYLPLGDEVEVFEAAYQARLPVLLKGPTGCGKTRFVEYMAWRLFRQADTPRRARLPWPISLRPILPRRPHSPTLIS